MLADFMQLRFEELFFLLKGYPRITGNTCSLSTHMYYDDVHDAYIIANFESDADMGKSIRTIISIVSLLNRLGTQGECSSV